MRTRRSPRNQEILWRLLTPPATAPPKIQAPPRCGSCRYYSAPGRSRSLCKISRTKVDARQEDEPCFEKRPTQ